MEKSKYLSVCVDFLYTEVEKEISSLHLSRRSRNGSCPSVLISIYSELDAGSMELICW